MNRWRTAVGALVVTVSMAGCQPSEETATGTLRGQVLAGPTCPVVQDPPDPACADRPVAGADLVVEVAGAGDIARLTSDADGRFEAELPPGRYTLLPQPVSGLLGTAPAQPFAIQAEEATELLVGYDTGIR